MYAPPLLLPNDTAERLGPTEDVDDDDVEEGEEEAVVKEKKEALNKTTTKSSTRIEFRSSPIAQDFNVVKESARLECVRAKGLNNIGLSFLYCLFSKAAPQPLPTTTPIQTLASQPGVNSEHSDQPNSCCLRVV